MGLPEIGSWIRYRSGLGVWCYAEVVGYTKGAHSLYHPLKVRVLWTRDYEDRITVFPEDYRTQVLNSNGDEHMILYPTWWEPATDGPCEAYKQIYAEMIAKAGMVVYQDADTFPQFIKWAHYEIRVSVFGERDYRVKLFLREYSPITEKLRQSGGYGKQVRLIFHENEPLNWKRYAFYKALEFYANDDMPLKKVEED
jgi:hypothetical protein